ncbi:hypothetical protein AAGW05_07280 [Arthrobacter sp. LAPM80]|uniref:hypothetical protein n=1 Tax=Arthrobacter sp. LAPM80 TaxID=3141788 RepID=UPI00398B682B
MSDGTENRQIAAIRPVKESAEDQILSVPGVVGVDIGEKISGGKPTGEMSILVYVKAKKKKSALSAKDLVPPMVDGVKTDVQELVIELQAAMGRLEGELQIDAGTYTTLHGGIGMGPSRSVYMTPPDVPTAGNYVFVGTLGAMVRDRASGATMALTNFHVAAINSGWNVGDRMVQPGRVDGGNPATQEFGALTRAQLTENTDGAVVTVDSAKAWDYTVEGIGDVAGTSTATAGMAVQKRGRTTEHTFGNVASADATISIDYGDGIGTRTLRHQIRISTDTSQSARFSDHGDSGSTVMDMNRNVVALLFAGSSDGSTTFANPIAGVLNELGVDILVRPVIVVTRPLISCLNTRIQICDLTRPTTCFIQTRTAVCTLTRPVICEIVTRTPVCNIVTRTPVCNIVTRTPVCNIVTRGGCPGPHPGEGMNNGANLGYGDPTWMGSQYDTGPFDADPSFVAGYLAALEEIVAIEEEGEN